MSADLDVAVIGAGAAGLTAAAFAVATAPEARVAALESAARLGAKILISGGGRCNVTHDVVTADDFNGNRNTIARVLRTFTVEQTVAWLASYGVTLKREETGKLFPTTDRARTIVDALLRACQGAEIRTGSRVESVTRVDAGFLVATARGSVTAERVILATGGRSVPKTGSDGHGYDIARSLGHTITDTFPALVPLLFPAGHPLTRLSGVTIDVELSVRAATGRVLVRHRGSMLFTHFGVSGPVVLDASRDWIAARRAGDSKAHLTVSFLPDTSFEQLEEELLEEARANPRATVISALRGRTAERVLEQVAGDARLGTLPREERRRVVRDLLELRLPVERDRGFDYAEVTAGGVPLAEIDPATMQSRRCRGLYLCGEILDVDGHIGGYNFQWAWPADGSPGSLLPVHDERSWPMKRPVSQLSILPWLVFAGFMALTVLATRYVHQMTRAADRARFENALQSTRDALEARLDAYMNVLIATRGVVVVDPTLPRRAVHDYIASLDLQNRYPGVQGLGLTMRFPAKELERVEEEMRSSGIDDFRIWPKDPPRDEYHAIVVIEPLDARNRAALGYDMFTHDGRRQAMIRARDTGAPAASGMVTLVQEIEKQKQPGFLIYAPLYATGTPPPTVALRRAALVGYVYAPFRAYDLLTGIFGRQERPEVGFEIRDQGDLLYRTAELPAEPRFTELTTMNVAGRTWTIRWESRRQGGGPALRLAVATFTGGVIISILLLMLLRVQLSARQQAEETAERLLQSEAALQRANAAKDDFLATLSHELRTPMTAIMGWAEILRGGSMDPESQQYALQAIHQSSRAQAQLIEDLLDVSRIAAGKLRLEKKRIDLKGVVEDAVATVRGAADARGIRIESDLAPEVFVHGDPQRLTQVVWNLVSNAVKFSPDDSSVEVSLRQAHQEAVIEVRDRGTGIDPAFMPHLFERFRQADSSSTRPHTGLGLGLAIVQHIVGLHEGSVEAESPGVGEGATFRVRLPLAQTRW